MEPPVSLPSAPKQNPAETATPDPLDDAPDQRSMAQGFLGTSRARLYPLIAPSVRFNYPNMTAPACRNFVTNGA